MAQLRKLDYLIGEQKKNKKFIMDALAQVPGVGFRAKPDPDGDSATFLAFNLPDENQAQKFQNLLAAEGVDTVCYKRNLWHYVPNWEHFLARSTANSKKYPFTDPTYKGKIEYSGKHSASRRYFRPHAGNGHICEMSAEKLIKRKGLNRQSDDEVWAKHRRDDFVLSK